MVLCLRCRKLSFVPRKPQSAAVSAPRSALRIGTHYTDTGGASDHVFILCTLLGFRFCPRLRDFPERKLACIAPASTYPYLQPLLGQRIKSEVIREHWGEIVRLVASLKAGTVVPSVMLRKLAAYRR